MNFTKNITASVIGAIFLSGCITVNAGNLDFKESQNLNLSSSSINKIDIEAGAGFIKFKGVDGLNEIRVTADLEVEKDSYRLTLDKKGNTAVLIAEPNTRRLSFFSSSPKIDLTIEVPNDLLVEIKDGSGYIEIKNHSGDLDIDDGSGSIEISNHQGKISLDDGSGEINISQSKGEIKISDGSGSINIENAGSDVSIDDGSGSIDINSVQGKVKIDDGSGGMKVVNVVGHVTIDDGSGDISVSDLKNGLTIINSGSGGLVMNNVQGNINSNQ